jgi:predicted Zn-dependent protease
MAIYVDIQIDQGSTFSMNLRADDVNGASYNLTGYSVRAQARRNYASTAYWSFTGNVTDALKGAIAISMTAAQTAALKSGRYVYDVEIYNNSGIVVRIAEGQVEVTPRVSRS